MRRVHLEVADVSGASGATIYVDISLADRDATDHFSGSVGNSDVPAIALELVQSKKVGPAIHSHAHLAVHRTRRGELDQRPVVSRRGVAQAKVPRDRARLFAQRDGGHFTIRQMAMRD